MSATIKVTTPSLDQLAKFLKPGDLGKAMSGTASYVAGEVKKRWQEGKGADNAQFSPGNPNYLALKSASGRNGKIDLNLTGGLSKSFYPRKVSTDGKEATIAFGGSSSRAKLTKGSKGGTKDNLQVARGLVGKRPNILEPDNTLRDLAEINLNRLIRKAVKFK